MTSKHDLSDPNGEDELRTKLIAKFAASIEASKRGLELLGCWVGSIAIDPKGLNYAQEVTASDQLSATRPE